MPITSMSHLTHVARSARRLSRPVVRNTTAIRRAAARPSAHRAPSHRPNPNPSTLPGLPAPAARGVRLSPWMAGGAFVAATYATGAENVGELEKKHTWNRSVALGSFVKSGIKMNEELIAPTHERIAKDATRKAIDIVMRIKAKVPTRLVVFNLVIVPTPVMLRFLPVTSS